MKDYLLETIRQEGPIHASVLKSDLRTLARNNIEVGCLDENLVLRTLIELEGEGLIRRTAPGANQWEAVFAAVPVKAKQMTFLGGSEQ
jgi:DNA-binding HxlR family transcriptional regulator